MWFELLEDNARLTMAVAGVLFGVVFMVAALTAPAIFCFLVTGGVILASIQEPESSLAIQEDARARERRRLSSLLVDCFEREGLEVDGEQNKLECDGSNPPSFLFVSSVYGMSEEVVSNVCEGAVPVLKAVRYTVDRVATEGGGRNGYRIRFYETTETETLAALKVDYRDIEGEKPTYKRIPIGLFEDGRTAFVSLDYKNVLVSGIPRSGKSCCLSTLVVGLCRCQHERILILSPKILDFQAFSPRAELYQKPHEILAALRAVNAEVERRKALCEQQRIKKLTRFSDEIPHIAIIVDEYAVIKGFQVEEEDSKKPRKIGEEIERELLKVVAQASFAGVQSVITSQRLSSNVISTDLRDICSGNLISFSNGSAQADKMVFGDYAEHAPASQIPITAKGVGFIFAEGDMERPKLFKCALTDMETELRIAEETRERKPRAGR